QKQQATPAKNQHVTFTLTPPADLAQGNYSLTQDIIAPNGEKYRVIDQAIRVVPKMPQVYIDKAGFTVVDGKRFFPMGVYLHTPQTTDDHLQRIAEGGFNTILTYGYGTDANPQDYLNRAASHQLKVIYAVQNM